MYPCPFQPLTAAGHTAGFVSGSKSCGGGVPARWTDPPLATPDGLRSRRECPPTPAASRLDRGHAVHRSFPAFFADKELYLLRNLTGGKGIGFFEAGNFYPDFILWLLVGDHQYVTFIDPKGIVRLERADDPKIVLHRTIKEIEAALGDPDMTLNSFIVSNTRYADVATWGHSKEELRRHHVLFQQDDRATYIGTMLDMLLTTE